MTAIVIPAYKPDQALTVVAAQLLSSGYQIIVVDDGSGKEYQPIFEHLRNTCTVLTHPTNYGKGAAIKTALRHIENAYRDCDTIGVMDADGQHMAEDMAKLIGFSKTKKNALVLGVRAVGREMPLRSRIGNQMTRMIFSFASGVKISDTQTGLRAFGIGLIPELLKVKGERYEYEMNVLLRFVKVGIPIAEVPIHTVYHDRKNSCSHFRVFRDSVMIYRDILKFALSSLSSFALDYILFSIFAFFLPHTVGAVLLANIAARIVRSLYNYMVNCRFVFCTKEKAGTAAGYFALAGLILLMNSALLSMFVHLLRLSIYPAKLLTECLLFLLSWQVQNGFIFRRIKN